MKHEQKKDDLGTFYYWDIFANTCWPFDEDIVICGRSEGQFQYEDSELSKRHCQFSIESGKCFLTDLQSSNGTYLNLKELTPASEVQLKCFDVIIFGSQIIIFLDEEVLSIQSRDELLAKIEVHLDNEDIFNQIKMKSVFFMKSHHSRMLLQRKIKQLESKIASAYIQKDQKLSKYVEKVDEVKKTIILHRKKIDQLTAHIEKVETAKAKIAAKIDPQISELHRKLDEYIKQHESIEDKTSI